MPTQTNLTASESARLDATAARLGVTVDDLAAAAVVSFLAGRDTPRGRRAVHRRAGGRAASFSSGRITPRAEAVAQ